MTISGATDPADTTRWRPFLFLLMILAVFRLGALQWKISHADFQGDFTAYWVAGRAALHGVNPYQYSPHSASGQPFPFTGFLYPPLAATLFAPLGLLDFFHAKLVWSALQLLCLLSGLGLAARLLWPRNVPFGFAVLTVAAALFPPILVEFERGQVDCLTFLLLVGGAYAWLVAKRPGPAAALLIAAGLFKLPALLLLAVPLVARDARLLRGAAVSLAVAVILTLALNGLGLNRLYWFHYLPTIAGVRQDAYVATNAPPAPPTPPGVLPSSQGGPPLWPHVTWEGHTYVERTTLPDRGSFVSSYMSPVPARLRTLASDGGYLLLVVVLVLAGRVRKIAETDEGRQVMVAAAMVTVLVCHTLSWLMNYVWLLYAGPVLLTAAWQWRAPRILQYGLWAATLLEFTWAVPHATGVVYKALDQRFCVGSLLLYLCSLGLLLWRRQQALLEAVPVPSGARIEASPSSRE